MARITDLPVELVLQISGCWGDSVQELGSLSQCSRFMHWLTFDQLFSNAFNRRSQSEEPCQVFMKLVLHAIKHDSQRIGQWLCHHELSRELNGFTPSDSDFMKTVTYLHLSIIGDAPRLANQLVKYGTDVWEGGGDYPDITPLYLAIASPRGARNLDAALRIACSYALPRTCQYLLSRGADPNSLSRYGLAAIHLAVRKRMPWRNFELLARYINGRGSHRDWGAALIHTVLIVLRFGADPNLPSVTSREHLCGPACWRSPDCEHRGQAVLHFACSGAPKKVVCLLLEHGADPKIADDDGYLPMFSALCQDHRGVALQLLRNDAEPANPIIVQSHQSTALHIACRFASVDVALALLERGADANAIDLFGQTPLSELLDQSCWELEDRILELLPHLDTNVAVAGLIAHRGAAARQVAAVHPFPSVRKFFDLAKSDHPERDCSHIQHPSVNGPSAGSWDPFEDDRQQGIRPDIDSRESFPVLSKAPAHEDRVKQAPTLNSAWLNKKTTEQRKTRPPSTANHQRGSRWTESKGGATGSAVARDDGGEPSPPARSVAESRMSDSARFWGSLSSSQQKSNPSKTASSHEELKDASHRSKQRNKWTPWACLDTTHTS